MSKTVEQIDGYFGGLSWNQTFYGVAIKSGGNVWSNNLEDVLNYPDRVPGSNVLKSCWGEVRRTMINQCEG